MGKTWMGCDRTPSNHRIVIMEIDNIMSKKRLGFFVSTQPTSYGAPTYLRPFSENVNDCPSLATKS